MQLDDTFYDLSISSTTLDSDEGLATAVQLSLLTWARADASDPVPDQNDLKGWWGDTISDVAGDKFGSKLWICMGMPATAQTVELARRYILEALQWMIEDGMAEEITTTLEIQTREGTSVLAGQIGVRRPNALAISFVDLWEVSLAG